MTQRIKYLRGASVYHKNAGVSQRRGPSYRSPQCSKSFWGRAIHRVSAVHHIPEYLRQPPFLCKRCFKEELKKMGFTKPVPPRVPMTGEVVSALGMWWINSPDGANILVTHPKTRRVVNMPKKYSTINEVDSYASRAYVAVVLKKYVVCGNILRHKSNPRILKPLGRGVSGQTETIGTIWQTVHGYISELNAEIWHAQKWVMPNGELYEGKAKRSTKGR
jgi:hypothetical protein